ncbi:Mur ligase family protein [Gordonia sp. HS-NH1]|uniref:Mur ligase family protein n=1 Tax=Gordonia sp. HS-NH1 TaxID=1435068 RepID=UPI0006E1C6C6|nr:UDP-N-acetylmuramoyl-tripeptide--D-alanyl-D-alanine ligase [Gordonia sp. HS-NH1]
MATIITMGLWVLVAAALATCSYRWLRVAQREHYATGRMSAIMLIWFRARPLNVALGIAALTLLIAGLFAWPATIAGLVVAVAFPWNLAIHPKENRLVVTGRVKRLVVVATVLLVVACALCFKPVVAAILVPFTFLIIDLALLITGPIERAAANKYVVQAKRKLDDIGAEVVAITGSYGKTSTKNYAAQIISTTRPTVASPASFNNLLGLSSTVNNHLHRGTEVFVAEMGTYGPGEIRRLCEIFRPRIAAIITIGDAHLERMKNRDTIVRAKSEIVENVETAVLNIDVPELADLAQVSTARVIGVSVESPEAEVYVDERNGRWIVHHRSAEIASVEAPPAGHPINLAVAVGLALAAGVPAERIGPTLTHLPKAPHRAEAITDATGRVVIDDTYNANPVGAAAALRSASTLAAGNQVWTISPGMIELGPDQRVRNEEFARAATATDNDHLVVVGYTNRAALRAGADPGRVEFVESRRAATSFVTKRAQPGDVILYENDLPSHYP